MTFYKLHGTRLCNGCWCWWYDDDIMFKGFRDFCWMHYALDTLKGCNITRALLKWHTDTAAVTVTAQVLEKSFDVYCQIRKSVHYFYYNLKASCEAAPEEKRTTDKKASFAVLYCYKQFYFTHATSWIPSSSNNNNTLFSFIIVVNTIKNYFLMVSITGSYYYYITALVVNFSWQRGERSSCTAHHNTCLL